MSIIKEKILKFLLQKYFLKENKVLSLSEEIRNWLGEEGILYFRGIKKTYGTLNAIIVENPHKEKDETTLLEAIQKSQYGTGIPHCVHFNEGMKVRNKIRDLRPGKYTAHELDDMWVEVVEEAIKIKEL